MAFDTDVVCTISLTSGSKDFTVAGANLTTENVQRGEQILLPAKALTLTIGEVLTATTGRLTDNCPAAAAGAAQPARIHYQADLSRALAEMVNLRKLLGKGNVDALAGLTLAAGKGIRATGLNALGTYDLADLAVTLAATNDTATFRQTIFANDATNLTAGTVPDARFPARLTEAGSYFNAGSLNTLTMSGFYKTGSNAADQPTGQLLGTLLVQNRGGAEVSQMYISAAGSNVGATYTRVMYGSVWQPWREIETVEYGTNASGWYARHSSGLLHNILTGTYDSTNPSTQNYTLASSGLSTPFPGGVVWPGVNNGLDHAQFRAASPVLTAGGTGVIGLRGTGAGTLAAMSVVIWTISRWK